MPEPALSSQSAPVSNRLLDRVLYPLGVLFVSSVIAVFLMLTAPATEGSGSVAAVVSVRSLVVEPSDVLLHVMSQGTVEPRTEANLIPEVSGTVAWMAPSMVAGGRFERGEVLLRLDDRDYRSALTRAEAGHRRAEAEHNFAKSENERIQNLLERELASRSQAQNAARAFEVAVANLMDAQAALQQAQLDLERSQIRAPFSGRVRTEQVDVGQFVQRGSPIAVLYATDYVEVRLPISDTQLAYLDPELVISGVAAVNEATGVRLKAHYAGESREWQGQVVRTEGEIDTRSRMVHVVARVSSSESDSSPLPVGLFVKAEIDGLVAKNAYVIPRSAVRDGQRVLVIDAENRLHFRDVNVIRVERDSVIIDAGLNPGERICVSPLQAVVEGMTVSLFPDEG